MELYHVLNRGVDKRTIFLDSQDYARFVHDLYKFNSSNPAEKIYKTFSPPEALVKGDFVSPPLREDERGERLVDIHAWCLMKNHYHLLLSERVEGGLTLFLRKLNIGYAKYFNERHARTGTLFQGRTKKIRIESDAYFLYILHYIHLNPLDYFKSASRWRERDRSEIKNIRDALRYLDEYRWSSYLDYCGKKNLPSILTTTLFKDPDVFGNYAEAVHIYLKEREYDFGSRLVLE